MLKVKAMTEKKVIIWWVMFQPLKWNGIIRQRALDHFGKLKRSGAGKPQTGKSTGDEHSIILGNTVW
jgi:hypothetical protein